MKFSLSCWHCKKLERNGEVAYLLEKGVVVETEVLAAAPLDLEIDDEEDDEDLTNTMHYCLPTVCAECQTRWGAYCFLQSLHKPNLVSFVSESMTPIATGYIQLCASTAQAMHNWPRTFPTRKCYLLPNMAYNL